MYVLSRIKLLFIKHLKSVGSQKKTLRYQEIQITCMNEWKSGICLVVTLVII